MPMLMFMHVHMFMHTVHACFQCHHPSPMSSTHHSRLSPHDLGLNPGLSTTHTPIDTNIRKDPSLPRVLRGWQIPAVVAQTAVQCSLLQQPPPSHRPAQICRCRCLRGLAWLRCARTAAGCRRTRRQRCRRLCGWRRAGGRCWWGG